MPELTPLWSDAFLKDEIREQPEYQALFEDDVEFDKFVETARKILGDVRAIRAPDEQLTIERAITPLLEALGWPTPLPKRSLTSRDEIDLALHADEAQRELSLGAGERDQVLRANGIVECKEWGRSFDGSGSGARPGETAAQQLQRYLLIAGTDSAESLRWGMLTNGGQWRIYSYRARPRDRTWEVDLEQLLISRTLFDEEPELDKLHQLRLAWLFFRRQSWIPAEGERDSFLDRILEAGRRRDAKVADDLSDVIFNHVYPDLVRLFWGKQPGAEPDIVARAALTFLYRLLFIYYAEDRGMLDTENPGYRPHSLRYSVRDPIAELGEAASHSTVSTQYWQRLRALRAIIDQGDPSIGQPPYNGGLFAGNHAVLDEIELSDADLAPIIRQLSHTADGNYISYRSLEVQQLGSIYERLLERVPQRDEDGAVEVVISPYARKDSGSYYTPQELVDLIVEQTLTPLVEERIEAFRREPTEANDPAAALLNLTILDPAMGSGHFLITALDWLTDQLAALVNREWQEAEPGYVSPIRARLWQLQEDHSNLSDETLLQRMALKRCIYGVDKNPLAVELAKVALWLHTFTPPLPLLFLDHRIRAGDSLLGVSEQAAVAYLAEWDPTGITPQAAELDKLQIGSQGPDQLLHDALDLTIEEANDSFWRYDTVKLTAAGLRTAFNLIAGLRWLSVGMKKAEREEFHEPLREALRGHPTRTLSILYNGESGPGRTAATPEFNQIRDQARDVVAQENIFHWEIEFSRVMAEGGFDAVITNPPWDRIKLQEVEWWAARREEVAKAPTANARKEMIAALRAAADPLVAEYDAAAERAAQLSTVFRRSGDYPQLGKGDMNLYSLFVERAVSLLNDDGIAGILTPSGIYADKTPAEFFRAMSATGRIGGIFDFENRRTRSVEGGSAKWFSDVHAQFKFCATLFAGAGRGFAETRCGYFLGGKGDLRDSTRVFPLQAADFAKLNPNTGNAPILRSVTDAAIILRIHSAHPVLVQHAADENLKQYAVRYRQGRFHSQNDAVLFVEASDLERRQAYRVIGNRYRRGGDEWVPLYQGRMIDQFDHRANGVVRNPDNVSNQFSSEPSTDEQHADPSFHARPPYWVSVADVESRLSRSEHWAVVFRDVTNATNERLVIAAAVPWSGLADTLGVLLTDGDFGAMHAATLLANLNSLCLDYVAKQKVQSAHLKWFAVEQLPVIAPGDYDRAFGETTARDLIRDHVLRLTYTAHDLEPFARDLGYEGEPFKWDPAARRQLRARLDALYFHLYGLNEDDTAYILDQFPVLEKNERKAYDRYLTKELVLGHHRALANGDTTAEITPAPEPPYP